MKKKLVAGLLVSAMAASMLVGCGGSSDSDAAGKVYYLNFKPEADEAWQQLAKDYTKETGVEVKAVTAAEGKYEETLTAEIDKDSAPTLFQVSGTVGLQSWKDYCLDLSDSAVYKELTSDDFALKDGDGVYGVAYCYEGFGIIVNTKLLQEAGHSVDEITSFDTLKAVVEDITAKKDTLGFSAFTSSTLDDSSSWRFSGHLANMPLYYEFKDDNVTEQPAEIKGTYLAQFKNVWDLYTQNATIAPTDINSEVNAAEEFAAEKAVFYQNGTWAYNDIKAVGDDNLAYIPIYFGVDDANEGLCCGTENYWAVNSTSSEADQKATLDFLEWVASSDEGTDALANDMGFATPFKNGKEGANVLNNKMTELMNSGKEVITWAFNYTPNVDTWRKEVVSAMSQYTVSGNDSDWAAVESAFVDGWKTQYEKAHQ